MIHIAEFALKTACEKTRAHIVDFTAAPVFMNETTGAHEWLIEFEQEPNNLDYFKSVLDDTLKQINSDYEAKRFNNYVLQFPIVKALPKGTFYNWLKANNRLGGQFKVPRLSNDRKILDDVLKSVNA
jgi:hypothetical protein